MKYMGDVLGMCYEKSEAEAQLPHRESASDPSTSAEGIEAMDSHNTGALASANAVAQDNKRVPVSKRMRFEIFKRDGFECQYCGATPPGVLLHCDHIEPVSRGGKTEMDNLVTACEACNQGKSDILLSVVPQSLASRAAEVAEREAQIAGYQAILKDKRDRLGSDAQEVLELFCKFWGRDGIPRSHFVSIKNFVEKLGLDECIGAVDLSLKMYSYNRAFLYFCGICWRKIKERDGEA